MGNIYLTSMDALSRVKIRLLITGHPVFVNTSIEYMYVCLPALNIVYQRLLNLRFVASRIWYKIMSLTRNVWLKLYKLQYLPQLRGAVQ